MTSNEFMKFLEDCEKRGGKEAAASILFQLSREEMETNSQYSAALKTIKKILTSSGNGSQYNQQMDTFFKAVMQDENDHSLKFQWAASELVDISVGKPENVGKPIR